MLVADVTLARRLEGADAWGNAQFAAVHARLNPEVGALAVPVAGGYAIYAGADSPVTQAIGLGMSGPVATVEVERLEEFYQDRGAAVRVELCPLADPSLPALFAARGYRVEEQSTVLARPLGAWTSATAAPGEVQVDVAQPDEAERWAGIVAAGFAEDDAVPSALLTLLLTTCALPTATCFLARLDGQPAGGGAIATHQGVALLFATSTRPAFRKRGVQSALLRARLAYAAAARCDLAMVTTVPASASQRNMERQGFQVVYTRSTMRRD